MQSKLIVTLALTCLGTITIAGPTHSKSDPRIIMPTSEALRTRGTMLSMNVDELTRLGIFDAFAQKEVFKSEIPTMVDDALDACWKEHQTTALKQSPDLISFSVNITKQSEKYKAQRPALRAAVIQILCQEINAQQVEQTNDTAREDQK